MSWLSHNFHLVHYKKSLDSPYVQLIYLKEKKSCSIKIILFYLP
jgi:hypothetical protein